MSDPMTIWTAWEFWKRHLAGDSEEDLSITLTHVRLQARRPTQVIWANDWRTREFCDLGLHLLYEHHILRSTDTAITEDVRLFRNLGPDDLVRHAAEVIREPDKAEALGKQRWNDTWGHQAAFTKDLIAYLFRPGPYIRRVQEIQPALTEMVPRLSLGQFIRKSCALVLDAALADPLVALETFVQAALPTHPAIRRYVQDLDSTSRRLWAALYATIFPAYKLERRDGIEWTDIADLFTTVTDGALLHSRSYDDPPRLSNGDDLFASTILALIPSLFVIEPEDIDGRTADGAPLAG